MKKTTLTFIILLSINLGYSQNKQGYNNESCQKELLSKMYFFFTETLRNNYHINDDNQLYTKFIQDYTIQMDNAKKKNKAKYFKIKLHVKKKTITDINNKLLIRDTCNYYYFYKDRIVFTDKYKWEQSNIVQLKHPEVPITSVFIPNTKNKKSIIIPFEETYNININLKSDFFTNQNTQELRLVKILKEMNQYFGDNISIPMFASAISKQKSDILNDKRERFVIVVVFWKVLCVNANVAYDFHALPNNVKEIFGI